jgi:hypothetical protein
MNTKLILVLAAGLPLLACGPDVRDGAPGNPSSTAAQRAYDNATGTRTSPDGTGNNPRGTAAERAYDRATGSNTSGAYPSNSGGVPQR